MNLKNISLIGFLFSWQMLVGQADSETAFLDAEEEPLAETLHRKDAIPQGVSEESDTYLEGYIQALLNSHYYEFNVLVQVENRTAYLYNLPKNRMLSRSITSFVIDVGGIEKVVAKEGPPPKNVQIKREKQEVEQITGIWFPQTTVLFPPMIANPMETLYSVEFRWGDVILGTESIAVSYGDTFPIYRWRNLGMFGGDMQIGIQAGAWSVFKMNSGAELVNTDYLLGIPLSYAFDNWAFRLRIYHISGHLGDEFMVNNPNVVRVNPSMEAIDLFTQYQVNPSLRIYFGPGVVIHSDKSFKLKPLYFEYGFEVRYWGKKYFYHKLYGTSFLAAHFRNWQAVHWREDVTALLGYEFSKLQGVGRKLRFFALYHNGYSEGQFFKETSSYGGLGLSWGF